MKKALRILLVLVFTLCIAFTAVSCSEKDSSKLPSDSGKTENTENNENNENQNTGNTEVKETENNTPSVNLALTFDGTSISCSEESDAVIIDGTTVTLKNPGTYTLKGTLTDGAVIVDTDKTNEVELVFDGVSITNKKGSPLYIKSCDKTTIVLSAGKENVLTDAVKYELAAGEKKPNACIYSSDDLTIEGEGKLTVAGKYNNGIASKNDIRIKGGELIISAVNNAIKGNDSVSVTGGKVTVTACDDGLKSDNDTEEGRGFVYIENAELNITANDDAIQAAQAVTVAGGSINVKCGGKNVNCAGDVNIVEGALTEN